VQGATINGSFEVDHFAHRLPPLRPSPPAKLGFVRLIEPDRRRLQAALEQIPSLFLPDAQGQLIATLIALRKTIT
jgi:hypothetical protein